MESGQLTLFTEDTLASLLVTPGSDEARKMTATSGLRLLDFYRKSGPVGLLVRTLLGTSLWGSTMYLLTWKASTTPHKRLLFRLQPSTPHTDETESSLWPTVTASDTMEVEGKFRPSRIETGRKTDYLCRMVKMWPTPHANCHTGAGEKGEGGMNIQTAVKLWPTPKASDGTHGGPNQRDSRGNPALPSAIHLWRTPTAANATQGPKSKEFYEHCLRTGQSTVTLVDEVRHNPGKMWPTPTTNDANNATLPPAAKDWDIIPGALMREGYTKEDGQLNPEWVEALMNFPLGWTEV